MILIIFTLLPEILTHFPGSQVVHLESDINFDILMMSPATSVANFHILTHVKSRTLNNV